jgi:hypothetical protein
MIVSLILAALFRLAFAEVVVSLHVLEDPSRN